MVVPSSLAARLLTPHTLESPNWQTKAALFLSLVKLHLRALKGFVQCFFAFDFLRVFFFLLAARMLSTKFG
jgi:hypothetical protein